MHRELFPRTTGEGFDPVNPASIAADVTIGFMLQPDRAARMVAQNAVDQSLPGLGEVIDRLVRATFDADDVGHLRGRSAPRHRARAGRSRDVAGQRGAERAGARDRVAQAAIGCGRARPTRRRSVAGSQAESERAHTLLLAADIKRFLERPVDDQLSGRIIPPSPAPPGAPIGDEPQEWLARPPYKQ